MSELYLSSSFECGPGDDVQELNFDHQSSDFALRDEEDLPEERDDLDLMIEQSLTLDGVESFLTVHRGPLDSDSDIWDEGLEIGLESEYD